MKPLDLKDIAILDAIPQYDYQRTCLEIGCGDGKLGFYLVRHAFRYYATDIKRYPNWNDRLYKNLSFHISNIFDLHSFPITDPSVVICSEVLEHLAGWKTALVNLMALAQLRIIITVPWKHSFLSPEHVNFWDDKSIQEFVEICKPYSVAISKIRTKPRDKEMGQYGYLIVIDKRQKYND